MTITAEVKLVIWDLDDTFWKGTLSEGPIEPIPGNLALVRLLARRGIVSSICSKNERRAVEVALNRLGAWDDFALPSVSFHSKGHAIGRLIEALQLRPANVVFIDDNPSVRAEAAFTCPGLQCLAAPAELEAWLNSLYLRGSPDEDCARLRQYRQLAARFDEREVHAADDVDFLRQSAIRIEIDYAVENHVDRIIELINRSNQLNFTKVRIVDEADRAAFLAAWDQFGFQAGVVRAWDKYADYGVIGFFMTLATLREHRLQHFVFSCRVMNMGIEQYVYEYLKKPRIDVVLPVANGLDVHQQVDWIEFAVAGEVTGARPDRRLVFIGGCDMLQLSTYCSSAAREFTNREVRGIIKRLDDPFLLLDDPEAVRASPLRARIPAFDHHDMLELRAALAEGEAVVVSLYRMMEINYFRGRDGLTVRLDEDAAKQILASDQALWFVRNFGFVAFSHEQRQELIRLSFVQLARLTGPDCRIVVILENTRKLDDNPDERALREAYNRFVVAQAEVIEKLDYIDINSVTSIDWLFDDGFHMSRQGYFELARAVKARLR